MKEFQPLGHKRLLSLFLALVAALALVPAAGGGCRSTDGTAFTVSMGGTVVGGDTLSVTSESGGVIYESTERRPFERYDTTIYRHLTLSTDGETLLGYYSNRRVRGASFKTYVNPEDGAYGYFDNDLQTFDYVPGISPGRLFLPFEKDSACLVQAMLNRFLGSGVEEASALAVVPSRGPVLWEFALSRESESTVLIEGEPIGRLLVEFDSDGVLARLDGSGDLRIERGDFGIVRSEPFEPEGGARSVKGVRLPAIGDVELAGSLYLPRGDPPYRAVVLAGDHGPQDRTGGGFLSRVADHLAGSGYAVLTCDRRGIPESGGDYATYTFRSAVEDLNSQVDYLVLRHDIDIESITILGYGEGAVVGQAAAVENPYVSGLVLMAPPAVPVFPDLARLQVEASLSSGEIQGAEAEAAMQRIESQLWFLDQIEEDVVTVDRHRLFLGWLRSFRAEDPLETASKLAVPVLILQGEGDRRVPVGQAERLMEVLEGREGGTEELVVFEGLGHGFGPFRDAAESRPYRAHPVIEEDALDALSGWLERVGGTDGP
jgi:uncharacterized protein